MVAYSTNKSSYAPTVCVCPQSLNIPACYRRMIYDSEVSFVLSMQNRCALFVALYFRGLVTWQFYSFPCFPLSDYSTFVTLQVIEQFHISVSVPLWKLAQTAISKSSQSHL